MGDLLDDGDIDNDVSFTNYIKNGYGGISIFIFMLSIVVLYIVLTLYLFFYSGNVLTLVIMWLIVNINISHTIHKYLLWKKNKMNV